MAATTQICQVLLMNDISLILDAINRGESQVSDELLLLV